MKKDEKFFELVNLKTWAKLREEYLSRKWTYGTYGKWVFRGMGDASWSLQTSLERHLGAGGLKAARYIEFRITREFMRQAHHYLPSVPVRREVLEWLALMQHHGAPTRLQDWTFPFAVALHFALSNPTASAAAIWAVDLKSVQDNVCKLLPPDLGREWKDPNLRKDPGVLSEVLRLQPSLVIGVTPFRLNERVSIQQGTFLMPGNVSLSFNENFRKMGSVAEPRMHVVKLKFHRTRALVEHAIRYLRTFNITESSLFPVLYGYARHLRSRVLGPDFRAFPRETDLFTWAL